MAEKKPPDKAGDPATPDAGAAKKKKLLVIGAAVAALLLIGGVVGWLMLAGGEEEAAEADTAAEAEHAPASAPAIYASLGEKFVVTLQFEGRQHYLQMSLSAMTREQAVVDDLKLHEPLIRSRLVSLLGAQDFAALRTDAGKLAMRGQVLAVIQEVLTSETGKAGVDQVFLTDLVLQ